MLRLFILRKTFFGFPQAPSTPVVPRRSRPKCFCRPLPHIDGLVLPLGRTSSFQRRPGVTSPYIYLLPFYSKRFTYSHTWHLSPVSLHVFWVAITLQSNWSTILIYCLFKNVLF